MQLEIALARLSQNLDIVRAFTSGMTEQQGHWRPQPGSWSIVEVVGHLVDEEVLDFRTRTELALFEPDEPFPPIDPPAWVTAHAYASHPLTELIAAFTTERHRSLAWLAQLDAPDWSARHDAPWGGSIAAGDLLASWIAHDHLHIRQLNELHYAYLESSAEPYAVEYAGEW